MQLPRTTLPAPTGLSFDVPDLLMLHAWAEYHELRMTIDLDTFTGSEEYEEIVSRFRSQSAGTPYRGLNELFVESLEAFEVGRLLGSIHPLLSVLDHLERMQRDKEIEVGRIDQGRTGEYRSVLNKILPGNKPELDGAGRGM